MSIERIVVPLTDEKRASIIDEHGPGQILVRQCPLCAWTRWISTAHIKGDSSVQVECMEVLNDCEKCFEAFSRHPELARWIVSVVTHHDNKAALKPTLIFADGPL